MFQYLIGTIETSTLDDLNLIQGGFQYLIGTIETLGDLPVICSVTEANQSSDRLILPTLNTEVSI